MEKKAPETCPKCGADVWLKVVNQILKMVDSAGQPHQCSPGGLGSPGEYQKHPIGQAMQDQRIVEFQLRGRVLTIKVEDGHTLSVSAAGKPLTLRLEGPGGILQE